MSIFGTLNNTDKILRDEGYSNNDVENGYYSKHLKYGEGWYYAEGICDNGNLNYYGKVLRNGVVYEGEFKNNKKNGKGIEIENEKIIYGNWVDD